MIKHQVSCEGCGKLAELPAYDSHLGPSDQELPKTWRRMQVIFLMAPVTGNHTSQPAEVCSPGCAKEVANRSIDAEWESTNGAASIPVPAPHSPEGWKGLEGSGSPTTV